jgi:hypothetical protein
MFIGIKLVPESQTMHFTHHPRWGPGGLKLLSPMQQMTMVLKIQLTAFTEYNLKMESGRVVWVPVFPTEIKGHLCSKEKSIGKKRSNTKLMITGIGISRMCFGY